MNTSIIILIGNDKDKIELSSWDNGDGDGRRFSVSVNGSHATTGNVDELRKLRDALNLTIELASGEDGK